MKPSGTDDEHGEKEPDDAQGREIAGWVTGSKGSPETTGEVEGMKKLAEQFEARVGSQAVIGEAEGQIGLDRSRQIAFSISHRWCPFGSGRSWLCFLFLYDRTTHWAREKAASLAGDRLFLRPAMTNWG
jgi:hypothetical protein